MDYTAIAMLVLGVALGAGGAWMALRLKCEQAAQQARRDSEMEAATLGERLLAREREIAALHQTSQTATQSTADLQQKLSAAQNERVLLATTLQKEREQTAERLATLQQAEQNLTNAFKALAAEALQTNNATFLNLAKTSLETYQQAAKSDLDKRQQAIGDLVAPVKTSLDKVDAKIQAIEKDRVGAYASLNQQMQSLAETERQLRSETANLVKALRAPNVRGRWGEMQLRRVVELAGMVHHCDFYEQVSETTDEVRVRPDMVVRLPGGVSVIVDAKVPLSAYLDAMESADEEVRRQKMKEHARQVLAHVATLSRKAYWEQFQPSPDFVIMFLPGESYYDAAREHDPTLVEAAVNQRVMIATPMSLITLLRTVAVGWRQEALARNAQEISELGKTLYKRLSTLGDHLMRLGRNLDSAVKAYNDSIGSLETNVLSGARKFRDLGAADGLEEIPDLQPIDRAARKLQRIELLPSSESTAATLAAEEGIVVSRRTA